MEMSFRYKLSSAIKNIRSWSDLWRSDMELLDQVTAVVKLSRDFDLSISLVRLARRNDPASHDYNCFMWAFGLLDRHWLSSLIPERQNVYPRSDFADYLVGHHLHEVFPQETRAGDVVVYFKAGKPVHAGKWNSGLVISKWGLYSHLWKHGPCELPIEYGDEIRFYRSLPEKKMRDVFEQWCRDLPPTQNPFKNALRPAISPVFCGGERHLAIGWAG